MEYLFGKRLQNTSRLSKEQYTIGIICAHDKEMLASQCLLDENHGEINGPHPNYPKLYTLGRLSEHNVVLCNIPIDRGAHFAVTAFKHMLATFRNLKCNVLLGTGAGVPSQKNDIRLGDVVIGVPVTKYGEIVQHQASNVVESEGYELTGSPIFPPGFMLSALLAVGSTHEAMGSRIPEFLDDMIERYPEMKAQGYGYNQTRLDLGGRKIPRYIRPNAAPIVHQGLIASGRQVLIKDGQTIDYWGDEQSVLCFEEEGAYFMSGFPSIVIRGISKYCDSQEDTDWEEYAAAVAAGFAKELLTAVMSLKF